MRLKFKRHYKLLLMLVLISAVLTVGFGQEPIVAYTVDDGALLGAITGSQIAEGSAADSSGVAQFAGGASSGGTISTSAH